MGLGPDHEIAKGEFVEAMRARLEAMQEGLGENVDEPDVNANLGALGEAVYRIATVQANTSSSAIEDAQFWSWVNDVNAWLGMLSAWQVGMVQAFESWVPTDPQDQALKATIIALADPGLPPADGPTSLTGRIE